MPYGAEDRGSIRVLFIDDDVGLGILVKKSLARAGHRVTHVTSSDDGFARLASGSYDVIALDHSMPGETGINVLAKLGPRSGRPPVVYVTGSSDARTAVEAIKAGADDYVIKDTSGEFFELLIESVEQVMDRWRFRNQKAENERAVREARDRAEILLKEVNHRVSNSLGLVAAMVRLQANSLSEPGAIQALQETQMRISAIAGVHRWLYTSEKIGQVEIDKYIGHLVTDLRTSLSDENRPYEIKLTTDKVMVNTDKAVSIGVIVGELVTNAFKYAYDLAAHGDIRVKLKLINDDIAQLIIEDDGRGFDPDGSSHGTGLGSRILSSMATTLRATVTHQRLSPGARITVQFPLT